MELIRNHRNKYAIWVRWSRLQVGDGRVKIVEKLLKKTRLRINA